MRGGRDIINTNVRFNMANEADRQAYEYLKNMDRTKYKSYSKVIILAINEFFSKLDNLDADSFLISQRKEEAIIERLEAAVERGAKESMPIVLLNTLTGLLAPYRQEPAEPIPSACYKPEASVEDTEVSDAALDFADCF